MADEQPKLDLEPCPFCGARLIRSESFSSRRVDHYIHPAETDDQVDCFIASGVNVRSNSPNSITAWNTRSALSALAPSPSTKHPDDRFVDDFNGDNANLLDSTAALLRMHSTGALSHPIPGLARQLLSNLAARLSTLTAGASNADVEAKAIELCEAHANGDLADGDDGLGEAWPYLAERERIQWRAVARRVLGLA